MGHLGEHVSLLRGQVQDQVKIYCEIDLKRSHAERITDNIIDLVRQRSQQQIKSLPVTPEQLKQAKSISAEDILSFLPLSRDGLRELQAGGSEIRENVLSLSRLHRLCKNSGIPEKFIPQICGFKAGWDLWIQDKKLDFEEPDLESLKVECIKALSGEDTSLSSLGEEAKSRNSRAK